MPPQVFLLSPVRLDGPRGALLRSPTSRSPLVQALRTRQGAPIGDVFSLVSGLYFRGKLAYARAFARPPQGARWLGSGVLVMTHGRGLVPAESRITLPHLELFGQTPIGADEAAFTEPLQRDATRLARDLGDDGRAILLGSVATRKYLAPLSRTLGAHLVYPEALVGAGDMRRGSILLRHARDGQELRYVRAG